MKAVIFDIDGTLSNPEHRLHYLEGGSKDWESFLGACGEDTPYPEIVELCSICLKCIPEDALFPLDLGGTPYCTECGKWSGNW